MATQSSSAFLDLRPSSEPGVRGPTRDPSFDAGGRLEVEIGAIEGVFARSIEEIHKRPKYECV